MESENQTIEERLKSIEERLERIELEQPGRDIAIALRRQLRAESDNAAGGDA